MTTADCLAELSAELKKGRIVEARLASPAVHCDGVCVFGSNTIYIDPRTAIVSTLLHELLHRRYPSWTEARVLSQERRLIRQMTTSEVSRWYREYQRAKRTRSSVLRLDDE